MPLLNFKKQFVEPIRTRRKRHTIRADRKIPIKVGDKLYLYCGARTKNCFKILPEPTICTKTLRIQIHASGFAKPTSKSANCEIVVDGVRLDPSEKEQLARADGFDSLLSMAIFWLKEHGQEAGPLGMRAVKFKGHIIHWR